MSKFKKMLNKHPSVTAGVLITLALVAGYAISWIITCGLIKLIAMCFGWTFSWTIATGIWLIMCIAKSIFSHDVTVKK